MATAEWNLENPGFDGEMTGLGLTDVIQLNAQIRLTGSVSIRSGQRLGLVFMCDGQVVHAEQGDLVGEPAFYEIMSWRGGCFAVKANVTTACWTIRQTCTFLLLEAHRLLDERRAAQGPCAAVG